MEMLLGDLGITAKTNFLHIKGLFDKIDADGSGEVDGQELTGAALAAILNGATRPLLLS